MARRGGFSHNYDAIATRRFLDDQDAVAEIGQDISVRLLAIVEAEITALAARITAEHRVDADVARLFVAQRAAESIDFLKWVKAGEARAAGVPGRGLLDAMGYSSPTSVTRHTEALDHVVTVRARVDATGAPEDICDDRGYTVTLHPRTDGVDTVEQARKRGLLTPSAQV